MRRVLGLTSLFLCFAAPAAAHDVVQAGTLGAVHMDGFGRGPTEYRYTLTQGGTTQSLLPTQLGGAGHGSRVVVRGSEEDGRLVGAVVPKQPAAAPAPGQRSLAVVLMNWTGDQRQPWTPDEVRDKVFTGAGSMNAYFKEETYDRISFDGDVFGWYTIDAPSTGCDTWWNGWMNLAMQAATADAVDLNAYQHVMFVFPQTDCSFGGLGTMPGPYTWINGDLGVWLTAHEIGHNLGLAHANAYACTEAGAPVTTSDSCVSMEYGDPLDVMGGGGPHHNSGYHLQRLGALDPANVQTITESGTYTMHAALTQTTEPTTLRIPRTRGPGGTVLDYYYLEIRQSGGAFENDYFASEPALNGVLIRIADDPSMMTQPRLLKSIPAGMFWRWEAPFLAGTTFTDGQVQIDVTSAGAGVATVAVTVPDPPDTQAPTVPTGLEAGVSADGVELTWTASTDDHGVESYAVFRDGTEIGSAATPAYTDAAAAPGEHAYVVAAEDAAHNRSGLSVPATATVPGDDPPVPGPGPEAEPGPSPDPVLAFGAGPEPPAVDAAVVPTGAPAPAADRQGPAIRVVRKRRRGRRVAIVVRATDARGVASLELVVRGKRRRLVRGTTTLRFKGRLPRRVRKVTASATDVSGNRSTVTFRLSRRR